MMMVMMTGEYFKDEMKENAKKIMKITVGNGK